jgi:hypothetical protein
MNKIINLNKLEEGQEANYSQRYCFLPGLLFTKRKEITAKIETKSAKAANLYKVVLPKNKQLDELK